MSEEDLDDTGEDFSPSEEDEVDPGQVVDSTPDPQKVEDKINL